MKQLHRHFWYCTIVIATTSIFITNTDQESYNLTTSGGASEINPLDATLQSFKSSTTRALKTPKNNDSPTEIEGQSLVLMSAPEKKGWIRTQFDKLFDPSKKKKTLRNMNIVELNDFKNKCLAQNDRYNAIRVLERMVPICTDLEKLRGLLLELADLLFEDNKLESSGKMYREFVKYYPGNEKVEYALYKAIICKFYTILNADRDQSNTSETIELANKFLEREGVFLTHSQEVRDIRAQCYQRLLDNEISVFNFYIDRGRYKSAKTRVANIRKEFIELIPACEPSLIMLEIQLAQQVKDAPFLEQKQKELTEKFPTYQPTLLAHASDNKKNNIDRS